MKHIKLFENFNTDADIIGTYDNVDDFKQELDNLEISEQQKWFNFSDGGDGDKFFNLYYEKFGIFTLSKIGNEYFLSQNRDGKVVTMDMKDSEVDI